MWLKIKILFYLYNIIYITRCFVTSNYIVTNQKNDILSNNSFMRMSISCIQASNQTYGCQDIPNFLIYDPDSRIDAERICNYSRTIGFTNKEFTNLMSKRFNEEGFYNCTLSVLNNLDNKQLKNQCSTIYNELCN